MVFFNQGNLTASELEVQVMETRKKVGPDHPDTLVGMANLVSTYRNQDRWDAAERVRYASKETSKKKLKADYLDTLTSMINFASMLKGHGLMNKAISSIEDSACCGRQS